MLNNSSPFIITQPPLTELLFSQLSSVMCLLECAECEWEDEQTPAAVLYLLLFSFSSLSLFNPLIIIFYKANQVMM